MKSLIWIIFLAMSVFPWTLVTPGQTPPIRAEILGWERTVFAHAINSAVVLGGYQEPFAEPQNALMAYSARNNRWDILDLYNQCGTSKSHYMVGGGHDFGNICYDENLHAIILQMAWAMPNVNKLCCQYDIRGNIGRLYFRPSTYGNTVDNEMSTCYDSDSGCVYYLSGANFSKYTPRTNTWKNLANAPGSVSQTIPAYDKANKRVAVPGGSCYYPATNTWSGSSGVSGHAVYNEITQSVMGLSHGGLSYVWSECFSPYDNTCISVEFGGDGRYGAVVYTEQRSGSGLALPVLSKISYGSDARWKSLGDAIENSATGFAQHTALAVHNNELYLAWGEWGPADWYNEGGHKCYLAKWNAATWSKIGSFGETEDADYPALSSQAGNLYLSCNIGQVLYHPVKAHYKLSGSSIQVLPDSIGIQSDYNRAKLSQMVCYRNKLHTVFLTYRNWRDYGGMAHAYWNDATSKWVNVDTSIVSALSYNLSDTPAAMMVPPSAAVWNDKIVVAYTAMQADGKPSTVGLKAYNGTNWSDFPSVNVSKTAQVACFPVVAARPDGNELYIAYLRRPFAGRKNNLLIVEKYNGTAWQTLGGPLNVNDSTQDDWAFKPAMTVSDEGVPCVAWTEHIWGSCPQVYAAHWDGSRWVQDVEPGKSLNIDGTNGSARDVSIAIIDGKPTVAWGEHTFGNGHFRKTYVKQFDQVLSGISGRNALKTANSISIRIAPNPLCGRAVISVEGMGNEKGADITITDISGKRVAILSNAGKALDIAGVSWNTKGLPAGMYFISVQTRRASAVKKIMVLR